MAWITDMRHFECEGRPLSEMPGRALSLALFQGAIVAWVSSNHGEEPRTNVYCRRSPGRARCTGEICASLDAERDEIHWYCPVCGDNGLIHGWRGTRWDRTQRRSFTMRPN